MFETAMTKLTGIYKYFSATLILGYLCLAFLWWQLPDGKFHVYFLDVGQGDSILIVTPESHQILVDGGKGGDVIEQLGEVMPFFDRSIDMIVVTHPDMDHIGGLVEVLKRFQVNYFLYNGVKADKNEYLEILSELNIQKIPTLIAEADEDYVFGDVYMNVLFPFKSLLGHEVEDTNGTSVSVRVSYGEHAVMLTGDLDIAGEKEIVAGGGELESEILKAGHHGSKTSSSMEFLNAVKPRVGVISAGKENTYGHPHAETLRNLYRAGVREIRRTDEEGRIEFVF